MAGENVEVWQYREQEKNHPDDGALAEQGLDPRKTLRELENQEKLFTDNNLYLEKSASGDKGILAEFNKRLDDPNHMTS